MYFFVYGLAFISVVLVVIGQLLFKYAAISANSAGSIFNGNSAILLISSFLVYGVASIMWLIVLRQVDLGKIYPIMSLAFVITPLASHWLFGESFSVAYIIGVTFLLLGLLIIFNG